MAQKYLVRCKDASQTAGTGTLTLDNSTSANWQTPAQAVTRTLLANGDTVRYTISNTANPVLYEEGIGTIGSAGLTLTRDTVRQSSSGTSKISWPSGGARDVVIAWSPGDTALISNQGTDYTAATFATNLGLPRLAAANTFTQAQTISQNSGAFLNLTNPTAVRTWDLRTTSGGEFRITDTTALVVPLLAGAGGTTLTVGATTTLSKSGGSSYENFPAGTTLQFRGAPPAGYTRINIAGSRLVRLADTADTPGAQGGAAAISGLSFSGTSGSTTLTESQIPAHTHSVRTRSDGGTFGGHVRLNIAGTGNSDTDISGAALTTGGGTGHTHTISDTVDSDGNWLPRYEIWVAASKN